VGERQGLEIRRPAAAAGGSAQNAAKRGQPTPLSLNLYSYSPLSSAAVRATCSKTWAGGPHGSHEDCKAALMEPLTLLHEHCKAEALQPRTSTPGDG